MLVGLTKYFQVPLSTQDYFKIVPILANYEELNLSFGESQTLKIAQTIIFDTFWSATSTHVEHFHSSKFPIKNSLNRKNL